MEQEKMIQKYYDEPLITSNMIEGEDYINISKYSNSVIGRYLNPYKPREMNTIFGKCHSVQTFIEYITRKGLPDNIFRSKNCSMGHFGDIWDKYELVKIPNYTAALAYIICMRIKQDHTLVKKLRANDKPIVYLESRPNSVVDIIDDKNTNVKLHMDKRRLTYLAIVRWCEENIKNNNFNTNTIKEFIEDCKENKDIDVFDGCPAKR